MSENAEKYGSVFPRSQYDVLKRLALSTTQTYSAYGHRGGKRPERIDVFYAGFRKYSCFSDEKKKKRLIDY